MDGGEDTNCGVSRQHYWMDAKRIRLAEAERTSDDDGSRSSTPDSMLFRDFQDPNDPNRCTVGLNVYDDPTEDHILRWQEVQLSRCITENTVNRVVESYIHMFNDNIRLEQSTLQMAIRMAIHEHGLQQNAEPQEQSPFNEPAVRLAPDEHRPTENVPPDRAPGSSSSTSSSGTSDQPAETNVEASGSVEMPQAIAKSYAQLVYDDDLDAVVDFEYDDFSDAESEPDHSNFLEAAVAAAIQKKGLSSSHSSSAAAVELGHPAE